MTRPHGCRALPVQGHRSALYAVLDAIVDGYFPVIDQLSERSTSWRTRPSQRPVGRAGAPVRGIAASLLLRAPHVSPEREVLNQLTNRDNPLIDARRWSTSGTSTTTSSGSPTSSTPTGSSSPGRSRPTCRRSTTALSDVMKRLTAVTAVLAGMGAVAGIFGMSEAGDGARLLGRHRARGDGRCRHRAGVFRRIDWV